jgi:hypothetical protein
VTFWIFEEPTILKSVAPEIKRYVVPAIICDGERALPESEWTAFGVEPSIERVTPPVLFAVGTSVKIIPDFTVPPIRAGAADADIAFAVPPIELSGTTAKSHNPDISS